MEQFETELIDFINSNPLPFEAKWYVLRHVYGIVDAKYREGLRKLSDMADGSSGIPDTTSEIEDVE